MGELKDFYFDFVKGRTSAEVFHGVFCVYSLLEKHLADFFKDYNLTPVKFNALMLIRYKGKETGLSQSEISRYLIVTPSNTTRLLDRLTKDGYIHRVPSREDRRINFVKITKKGEQMIDQTVYFYGEKVQQLVYMLDKEDAKQLSTLLLKWFVKLEALEYEHACA